MRDAARHHRSFDAADDARRNLRPAEGAGYEPGNRDRGGNAYGNDDRKALPFAPRGLRRAEAAAYVGVSPSTFDGMIREGYMPRPKRYRGRTIWDRVALE